MVSTEKKKTTKNNSPPLFHFLLTAGSVFKELDNFVRY